jgi:lipooligosaccharide transport system permease protein
MTLFSGTFFPVDQLPGWVQPVAWISPLWHGTELARAAVVGAGPGSASTALAALGHVVFLLVLLAGGGALALRRFRRRLHP